MSHRYRSILVLSLLLTLVVNPPQAAAASNDPILIREFHANGDAFVDRLWLTAEGQSNRRLQVVSGSSGAVLYTIEGTGFFGFDVQLAEQLVAGQLQRRLIITDPQSQTGGLVHGNLGVFDASSGALLYSFAPPGPPPERRAGLRVKPVADQNGDGVYEIVVEAAILTAEGWVPETIVVSGANGSMLRTLDAPFDLVRSFVDAGGRLIALTDVDGSGRVDLTDVLAVSTTLGANVTPTTQGDVDGDGVLTTTDLFLIVNDYLGGATTIDSLAPGEADLSGWLQAWGQAYDGVEGFPALPGGPPEDDFIIPVSGIGIEFGGGLIAEGFQSNSNPEGGGFMGGPPGGNYGSHECDVGTNCAVGGQSSGTGLPQVSRGNRCVITLEGCPTGTIAVGEFFQIQPVGSIIGAAGTTCTVEYSVNGSPFDPALPVDFIYFDEANNRYAIVQPACISIRYRCQFESSDPVNGPFTCCACEQCNICTPPAAEPECPAFVHIVECRTDQNWWMPDISDGTCILEYLGCDRVQIRVRYGPDSPSGQYWNGFEDGFEENLVGEMEETDVPLGDDTRLHTITFTLLPGASEDFNFTATYVLTDMPPNCEQNNNCCGDTDSAVIRLHPDNDCDGLSNSEEKAIGTDPDDEDSDDDGHCDGIEVHFGLPDYNPFEPAIPGAPGAHGDEDVDGLSTRIEILSGIWTPTGPFGTSSWTGPDPSMYDSDLDGLQDMTEVILGFDPIGLYLPEAEGVPIPAWPSLTRIADRLRPEALARDLDRDFIDDEFELTIGLDPTDPDSDRDGIRDGIELRAGTDPRTNYRHESIDSDGDGLSDYEEEHFYFTHPNRIDTDRDSLSDGFEVKHGLSPNNPYTHRVFLRNQHGHVVYAARIRDDLTDHDDDGLNAYYEQMFRTDIHNPDSDGDGAIDGDEVADGANPIDPADGGERNEGVCWFLVTINGGHHDTGCGAVADDDDPGPGVGGGIGGMNDEKLPVNWTVTIGSDGGSGDGEGGFPPIATGPNGERTTQLMLLERGRCYDITVRGVRRPPWNHDAGYLQIVPVNPVVPDEDGRPQICTTCCCMDVDNSGGAIGNYCCLEEDPCWSADGPSERTARICLPLVDLDIDSDNNDGLSSPEASAFEDSIETHPSKPGKIIAVSSCDSDGDDIPDFADGYNYNGSILPNPEDRDLDDLSEGSQFIPIRLRLGGLSDAENAQVRFQYLGSHPAQITLGTDPQDPSRTVYTPSVGDLRLWRKNGSELRQLSATPAESDYIIPMHPYSLADLGPPDASGAWQFYLEAVRPSIIMGGAQLTVEVVGQCQDQVHATAYRITPVAIENDGSLTSIATVGLSHPTPTLTSVNPPIISNIRPHADDPKRLIADVTVDVLVDDAASDLIAGESGVIRGLGVISNGFHIADNCLAILDEFTDKTDFPENVVPLVLELEYTKATEPSGHLLRPFDFVGEYCQTIVGLEVQAGWNRVTLTATNGYHLTGQLDIDFEIHAEPPEDEEYYFHLEILPPDLDPYNPPNTPAEPVFTALASAAGKGVIFSHLDLAPVPNVPGQFVHIDANGQPLPIEGELVLVDVLPGAFVHLTQPDVWTLRIHHPSMPDGELTVQVTESGNDTLEFSGTDMVESFERRTWSGWELELGETLIVGGSGGGAFNPTALVYEGPTGLVDKIEIGEKQYGLLTYQGKTCLGALDAEGELALLPRPFLAVSDYVLPQFRGSTAFPEASYRVLPPADSLSEFGRGFLEGCKDGGVSYVDDFVVLGKTVVGAANVAYTGAMRWWNDEVLLTPQEMIFVVRTGVSIHQTALQARDIAEKLWPVLEQLLLDSVDFHAAIMTLDIDTLQQLGEEHGPTFAYIIEFVLEMWSVLQEYVETHPREFGRLVGRVVSEVVIELVVQGVLAVTTAGVGNVAAVSLKVAAKSAKVTRIIQRIQVLNCATNARWVHRVTEAVLNLLGKLNEIANSRMCFVAGTLVHTSMGLVPIECVVPGDLVLSRCELTGVTGYRPVLDTFVTYPAVLYTVTVRTANGQVEQITGTGEHPVYCLNDNRFVPIAELEPGNAVGLAGGDVAMAPIAYITDVQVQRGPPAAAGSPEQNVTYNFEVEEFHTYFVGESGVWVHNTGPYGCEAAASIVQRARRARPNGTPVELFVDALNLTRTGDARRKFDANLSNTLWGLNHATFGDGAFLPNGDINWNQVWTQGQWKQFRENNPQAWRLDGEHFHAHHTAPMAETRQLLSANFPNQYAGYTEQQWTALFAEMPGMMLDQVHHTGHNGSGAFHALLRLRMAPVADPSDVTEVFDAIEAAYSDWDAELGPKAWAVARKWLNSKGLQ